MTIQLTADFSEVALVLALAFVVLLVAGIGLIGYTLAKLDARS